MNVKLMAKQAQLQDIVDKVGGVGGGRGEGGGGGIGSALATI